MSPKCLSANISIFVFSRGADKEITCRHEYRFCKDITVHICTKTTIIERKKKLRDSNRYPGLLSQQRTFIKNKKQIFTIKKNNLAH